MQNDNLENPLKEKYYRELRRKYLFRLSLTYIAPSIILILFFIYQYISLSDASRSKHILSVAESQSKILDIFLKERVGNLINLIDVQFKSDEQSKGAMDSYLIDLKRNSESFIDIGFFNSSGIQANYSGPEAFLEYKDYSDEEWFKNLLDGDKRYVITDIYLGLRNKLHFTIAVKKAYKWRISDNKIIVRP